MSSAVALLALLASASATEPDPDGVKFFEAKIRPLLVKHCVECHGADAQESELRVDTYAGLVAGGKVGAALTPGKVDESLLFAVVNYKDENLRMPPDAKLPDADIALIKEWIERGAPHPEAGGEAPGPRRGKIDLEEGRKHWAFQPIARPATPEVNSEWVKNPVDAFMLAKLTANKLHPVAPADKRTLLRRATFDLTGLPPTPEEMAEFLADESPNAFEKVVDRLLASPHYGERWGRHWLDVARYADSNGLDENMAHTDAWRYRDYVINSFNNDKPFNRFVIEQLAGDVLYQQEKLAPQADGKLAPIDDDFDLLVATGFLALGPKVLAEKDQVKMEMDIIDEQIDAIGQAVLGVTLACARCHDHKFDPLSTDDYYAVAGILKSTRTMQSFEVIAKWNEHEVATKAEREEKRLRDEGVAKKQAEIDELIKTATAKLTETPGAEPPKDAKEAETRFPDETKAELTKLRDELAKLKAANTALGTAMGVQEGAPTDLRVHIRGSHLTLGKSVKRGSPEVLSVAGSLEIPEKSSGRLEFARWAASDKNPLTPRVAVNRLWRWHFGEGLVSTTENFGKLGTLPTHPELLDWLAAEFIERGWSMKAMHKLIMLSSTYQLGSQGDEANALVDVDNKYHWRAEVQRLEAESIRDSLLAVSGTLDERRFGSMLSIEKWKLIFDHTSKDETTYDTNRRSVYLPVVRNNLYDAFSLFDYSNADVPVGSRGESTVAPQALYIMNSPLMLKTSVAMADRIAVEAQSDEARVDRLFELALSRAPTVEERQRFLEYLAKFETLLREGGKETEPRRAAWSAAVQSVFASNEFIYVN